MTTNAASHNAGVDRQLGTRLKRVVREFAASEKGGRAMALAALLLLLLFAINSLNVVNSYVGRNFMTAIEQRDRHAFVNQALFYAAVFAASTIAAVIYRFIEERLGLMWREWLTRRLTGLYLHQRGYYQMNLVGGLANPDQRIADDVRSFTATTLSLALIFLNGVLTMIAFSGVLWSISRPLFLTAILYATVGSAIAYAVGRPLVRLNYNQSDREADFRAQLVHVREHAESIALIGREPQLQRRLFEQVGALVANFKRIIAVNRNLGFFTTGYNYMIQLIPALIVAPLFIRGTVDFGVIPQSAMAFAQLIGAFSLVVNQFPQLSSYAAVLARLNALGDAHQAVIERAAGAIAIVDDDATFACEQLTLLAPRDDRPLVRDLSVEIPATGRLLILAPDDLVANTLVRAVAGLWRNGSGRLRRPGQDGLLIVPERPYLPPGTLRQMLGHDDSTKLLGDDLIWEALRRVGVDTAARRTGGLDVQVNWNDALSLDEQRLVSMAELLLAAPRLAVLERPSGALGSEHATDVLTALAERGIGCVAFDDDAAMKERFDVVVEIADDGGWTRVSGAGGQVPAPK